MDTVYIFGDSISRGHYGIPYSRYLHTPAEIHGYDGATLEQIVSYARTKNITKGSTLIFQGGANNVLYSFLSQSENGWNSFIEKKKKNRVFSPSSFESDVIQLIKDLQETHHISHLYLCTVMIENPLVQEIVMDVNDSIRTIAKECEASVIELSHITNETKEVGTYLPQSPLSLEKDASFIEGDSAKATLLSEQRSLDMSIDGIHPNDKGAKMIAYRIDTSLSQ